MRRNALSFLSSRPHQLRPSVASLTQRYGFASSQHHPPTTATPTTTASAHHSPSTATTAEHHIVEHHHHDEHHHHEHHSLPAHLEGLEILHMTHHEQVLAMLNKLWSPGRPVPEHPVPTQEELDAVYPYSGDCVRQRNLDYLDPIKIG